MREIPFLFNNLFLLSLTSILKMDETNSVTETLINEDDMFGDHSQSDRSDIDDFLTQTAFFDNTSISERYFENYFSSANAKWMYLFETDQAWDTSKFGVILNKLQQRSLISIENSEPHNSQFSLVLDYRDSLLAETTTRGKQFYALEFMEILISYLQKVDSTSSTFQDRQETLRHIKSCMDHHLALFEPGTNTGLIALPESATLFALAFKAHHIYPEAKILFQWALEAYEKAFGINDLRTVDIVNHLAVICNYEGQYSESEDLLQKLLLQQTSTSNEQHFEKIQTLENLANCYCNQGRYREAEDIFHDILNSTINNVHYSKSAVLITQGNLGIIYSHLGRFAEAEKMFKYILNERKKHLQSDHEDLLTAMHNLAALYCDINQLEDAEDLYHYILAARTLKLGLEHPLTLKISKNLATIHLEQGQFKKAENELKQVLTGSERVLGKHHPDTISALDALALACSNLGYYDEAEDTCRNALALSKLTRGPSHPYTLAIQHNFAYLCQIQGLYSDSEAIYRDVLDRRGECLGIEHPLTLQTLHCLYHILQLQNRTEEAEDLMKNRSLQITEINKPPNFKNSVYKWLIRRYPNLFD